MPSEDERRKKVIARVEAMSHPLRVAMTSLLTQSTAKSAAEMSEELDEPVERIRYQLRQLVNAGVVQVGRTRKRRGVMEQFYVSREDAVVFDEEELELVPEETKRKMTITFLRVSFREALRALSLGTMLGRADAVLVRTPMRLDEQGWTELAQIHHEAFDRVQKLRAKSAKRSSGKEPPISATSILLFFESRPPTG